MADVTDAGNLALHVNLIAARIRVDGNAVIGLGAYVWLYFRFLSQCVFMGPDYITWASIGFALAGIEDIHLINLVVAVPVVGRKVGGVLDGFQCRDDHLTGMFVVSVCVIAAVVALFLLQPHGTADIERKFKGSVALRIEIVRHRANKIAVFQVFLIGNAIIQGFVVSFLEISVTELYENDESFLLSNIWRGLFRISPAIGNNLLPCNSGIAVLLCCITVLKAFFLQLTDVGFHVYPVLFHVGISLAIGEIMQMLVAHQGNGLLCPVGECDGFLDTVLGGNSQHYGCNYH